MDPGGLAVKVRECGGTCQNNMYTQHPGNYRIDIHSSFMNNYGAVVQNGKGRFTVTCALKPLERENVLRTRN